MNTTIEFTPNEVLVKGTRNSQQTGKSTLKNIGEVDFICKNVSANCGCTVPRNIKTGTILKPGETIEVDFSIKLGTQGTKRIFVMGNCVTASLGINIEFI